MPIDQALTIRGPSGNIISLDSRGAYDEQKAAVINTYLRVAFVNPAASGFLWICQEGIWVVAAVAEAHTVVGGSAATADVLHCAQGVAIASGTTQLTAVISLTPTAPAKAFGTLIAAPTQFTKGDVLGVAIAGTIGSYAGVIDVLLKKVSN